MRGRECIDDAGEVVGDSPEEGMTTVGADVSPASLPWASSSEHRGEVARVFEWASASV